MPAQVVLRQATLSVTEHSLDPAGGPIVDQLKQRYDARKYRIDLNSAPLTRFAFAQDTDGRWILIQLHHHLIGDHTTLEVVQEEIEAILDGHAESLPDPQPYRNLIAQVRLGVSVEEHEGFFRKMLLDIETPSLLYGLSEVLNEVGDFTESHRMLPQDLNDKLRGHAKRLGVSLAALCHLAWAQVIAATSGQEQVVFGTVLFGRMQGGSGSDRALGLYINCLPIRVDVEGVSVLETVRRVQTELAALLEHEHASLAAVQRCSSVPSGMPLFNAVLNYRHNVPVEPAGTDSVVEVIEAQERATYPFVMAIEDFESSLGLTAQALQSYDPSTICGYMQQALQNLADALEHAPETPTQLIEILPAKERDLVIHGWNKTATPFPGERCIHQLFEDQVRRNPQSVAVEYGSRSMTYRALNNHAVRLAHKLVKSGVSPRDNVAILLNRSFELVIAQLAVLQMGAAYVPVDTKAPADRQAYVMSDCGARLLITDENTDVPVQIQTSLLRFSANEENPEDVQDTFDGSLHSSTSSLDTAYVMYTSGSTGSPKGVMVPHRGIANLVINGGYTEIGRNDRVAFGANPAFDASTFEIWAPLLNGGRLVVLDSNTVASPHLLAEALDLHQINTLWLTTSLFNQYVHTIAPALGKLKYLLCGGEQGSYDAFSVLLERDGPNHIINGYGPTEATTFATTYEISKCNQFERLPIGRPIGNTRVYVLDKHCKPVPTGVIGELYIGGAGVANGYLNRPDLTAERFLPDPFSSVPDARMYKSGDLVRYLPDGNLVFLGRNDDQVKIRGFRVELGEIETRLLEHDDVKNAVVVTIGDGLEKRLVAYVAADVQEQLAHTLREYVAVCLPEYMIPSAFVRLDAFPVTNNGKIDRRALPEPDSISFVTQDYVAPQGGIEVAVAALWSELLKIDTIGRHDNFFMLGGHSLLAVRMVGTIRSRLGIDVTVQTLFTAPTVARLAKILLQGATSQHDDYGVLLPLKTQGSRPPLFCIHPGLGLSWSYRDLAKYLHPEQPLYGLQARGLDGMAPMAASIEEMTLDYIEHIRKIQPNGPYHLLGWSIGGTVAQNMAVELERQGEQVSLLVIMDSTADYSILREVELGDHVERLVQFGDKNSMGEGLALWEKTKPISINNINLARRFTPSLWSGDILFFKATIPQEENMPLVDLTCWAAYTCGKIEVYNVESTHLEMDRPENIELVGGIIAAKMEELLR
ncbi:hypothetical protein BGX26_004984 [Mortierella sp. AD094]|nr:hypothetical protein BGX26_004984 [Mortierella sp. AD094]